MRTSASPIDRGLSEQKGQEEQGDSPPVPPHKERTPMPSKSAPEEGKSAAQWPAWTDEYRWELGPESHGPSEADALWAAENLNGDDYHTDEPTPDEVLDQLAEDAEAQSRYEHGNLPL